MKRIVSSLVVLGLIAIFPKGAPQAHSAPAAKLRLDVYTSSEKTFCVGSTIIYGKTESILIDTQYYKSEAARVADRIAATGTRLKAIIITHAHDDHYMGAEIIHERFPQAPIYMSAPALEQFKQESAEELSGQKQYVPDETPDSLASPEVLPTTHFVVDGQDVEIMQGQGDEVKTTNSFVWIPSLRAIIAGDIVFNGVHPWLANSTEPSRSAWLRSLEQLKALHPRIVVAGHKRDSEVKDSPDAIDFMEQYLRDFEVARKSSSNPDELFAAVKSKYPSLALDNRILKRSVRRAFPTK